MASAVCAPGFYSTQDGNGAPWVLYPVPSGTPVVQPHSDNKILHEPVGPALVCGPGLFTSWDNPDRSEHGTMQAGFWWQVFDGANPTGEIITDHDPDRVWRNKFQFIVID